MKIWEIKKKQGRKDTQTNQEEKVVLEKRYKIEKHKN